MVPRERRPGAQRRHRRGHRAGPAAVRRGGLLPRGRHGDRGARRGRGREPARRAAGRGDGAGVGPRDRGVAADAQVGQVHDGRNKRNNGGRFRRGLRRRLRRRLRRDPNGFLRHVPTRPRVVGLDRVRVGRRRVAPRNSRVSQPNRRALPRVPRPNHARGRARARRRARRVTGFVREANRHGGGQRGGVRRRFQVAPRRRPGEFFFNL